MTRTILLAGAAALLAAAPSLAKPRPHVSARASAHILDTNHNGVADWREMRLADANGNGILDYRERARVDINRNGIPDYREAWIDRNRDGRDDRMAALSNRYGGALCPPGLAKKEPSCMPPGQAKRLFHTGQRLSPNYGYYTPYNQIPVDLRTRYSLDPNARYIYRDNTIYVVDPTTRLVNNIINAIL